MVIFDITPLILHQELVVTVVGEAVAVLLHQL